MSKKKITPCPCDSGEAYSDCCGRLIDRDLPAPTPERLMRSRYTAYCLGNEAYLLRTWHESTCPAELNLGNGPAIKWTGLEIVSAPEAMGDEGLVEFIARFKENGRAGRLHERSRFRREHDRWYYLDGETN